MDMAQGQEVINIPVHPIRLVDLAQALIYLLVQYPLRMEYCHHKLLNFGSQRIVIVHVVKGLNMGVDVERKG
jgi:hypothetical protein